MRNPDRIQPFCDEFAKIWKEKFPDLRFGQLISNFMGWAVSKNKCADIFFPEDNKWIEWLKEYAEENSKW